MEGRAKGGQGGPREGQGRAKGVEGRAKDRGPGRQAEGIPLT